MRLAPFGNIRGLGVLALVLPLFAQDNSLEELIAHGRNLESAGKFVKAEEIFRLALKQAQKNADPFLKVSALDGLAATAADQALYADAERELLEALAIADRALGPSGRVAAALVWHLIGIYEECGKRALAEPLLRRFESIALTNTQESPKSIAAQLANLGWIYASRHNNKKALSLFTRAVEMFEKQPIDGDLARTLLNRSALFLTVHNPNAALEDIERARHLMSSLPQSPSLEIALAVCTGVLSSQTQRMSDADLAFQRAIEMTQASYGPAHPMLAFVLADYAGVLRTVGRKKEASGMAARAKRIAGANHQAGMLGAAIDAYALLPRQ